MPNKYFDPKKIYKYNKENHTYFIDVQLDLYLDLYNEWDFSPFFKRDLDDDLIEYLLDSIEEIPKKAKVIISFYLPENIKNNDQEKNALKGMKNYFGYLLYKTVKVKNEYWKSTIGYFFTGLLFLIAAYLFQSGMKSIYLVRKILPEGLFIGGWVLFWEGFDIIFFKINNLRKKNKRFKKLFNTPINFVYVKKNILENIY